MILTIGPALAAEWIHAAEARLSDLPASEAEAIVELGDLAEAAGEETAPSVQPVMDAKNEMCAAIIDMINAMHATQIKVTQSLK